MIRIGIEVNRRNLRCDLLENPVRYFFILMTDGRAALCIQTCDFQGEDIKTHIIDGLFLNRDGELNSIFEDGINGAILEGQDKRMHSSRGDEYSIEYSISSHLEHVLSRMPDLMDWIISSVLADGRNLVIHPSWSD